MTKSPTLPWRSYVLFASLVAIAVYGMLFWATFGSQMLGTVGDPPQSIEYGEDLRAFLGAGELAAQREGRSIYDQADPTYAELGASKFVYPPWFAIAMIPLSKVPFSVAFPLWSLFGVAAAWFALARARTPDVKRVMGMTLLTLSGMFALYFGQTTYFMVAVLMLATMSLARADGTLGAVGLAFLAFKPHLLFGFAVWWALEIRSRWRWLAITGAVTATLAAVSALWLPGSWPAFFSAVSDPSSLVDPAREVTLISVVQLLGATGITLAVGITAAVGLVLSLLFVGMRRWADQVEVVASLSIVASLLLAPHGLMYDWLLLLPAGALLVRARAVSPETLGLIGAVLGAAVAAGDAATAWQLESFGRALHLAPLILGGVFAWLVTKAHIDIRSTEVPASHP